MKAFFTYLLLFSALGFSASAQSDTDSTGLPGDDFSLEGALGLFKKSSSPEEFEKLLNTESNHVNNLDLDGDGNIDYIRVISKKDGNAHIFILQVPVNEKENQDIAVIELEKTGAENATLQIIGDEEIYGVETVVEPASEDLSMIIPEPAHKGPYMENAEDANGIFVNVWFWPCVRYVYTPSYVAWISPWRWHYYPAWWRPWRPLGWHVYHPYRVRYRTGFVVAPARRIVYAHRIYVPVRSRSATVYTRTTVARNYFKVTRSRTTVTGPRGNSVTRQHTTVQGRNGRVKASKTTVRRRRH